MLRWVNEYIEENQEKWENMDLLKVQENYEKKQQEEKQGRFNIINNKKRKFEQQETDLK